MSRDSEIRVTPYLHLNEDVAKRNAETMLRRAESLNVKLRPHVKTHKTIYGALLQTGGRRSGIVVSTLASAKYFHEEGQFDDIIYAVPIVTQAKMDLAKELHLRMDKFIVVVDSVETAQTLTLKPMPEKPWNVQVMVDCGYGRDGVSGQEAVSLIEQLVSSENIKFMGIYTHAGHSYNKSSQEEIVSVSESERDVVVQLARQLAEKGIDCPERSVGSTPTCTFPAPHLSGITEMHAGNYFSYDMMQYAGGCCRKEDIALCVVTTVMSHNRASNRILVDMGWTAYSQQGISLPELFGVVKDHPEVAILEVKQECGLIGPSCGEEQIDFDKYPIGMQLRIYPYHACATASMHRRMWLSNAKRFESIASGMW